MRVLVVEDEIKTGNYLHQGLTEAGFLVVLARNGLDGHHLAMTETFDVIILDVMLPDVDGWRIVQSLREAGRLEDSFNRLSNFSADIAHELRTPLTSLITQTQVGLGKARSPDEYRELLYSNLEEQERLAKMVNDMLWLAKSDHGLLKPVHDPLDLAGEINELFDFFGALAEDKQIQLRLTGTAPTIHGDRAMLRRAVSNLLSNAIRHTPSGKEIEVRLATPSSNEVLISIGNPGLEITAEHLPLIFNRFYMANPSRKRQSAGTGLGLAITRSIVEAHGGHVKATSTASVTTFTLWLPV